MRKDDTNRDRDVISIALAERIVFRRCFQYDQPHIIFFFKTAAFINIEGVGKKIQRNIQLRGQLKKLFLLQRGGYVDPGADPGLFNLFCFVVLVDKVFDHRLSSIINYKLRFKIFSFAALRLCDG